MKKILILIPVFNDWESLKKLISEIDENIDNTNDAVFECIILNDASTINQPEIVKPKNFKSFKVLNMKKNQGHARCNAFGIRFATQNEIFDYLILMDGDGEDRPIEIKGLLEAINKDPNTSVVAKRIKRSEGPFFQMLYFGHKVLTYIFTGKKINFGNYSCLTKKDVEILSSKPSLWSSYSGTVKRNIKKLSEINSVRGARYFGPSQMSFFKLLIHSFSIIAVFKYQVFLRSLLLILFLTFIKKHLGILSLILQILILIFNFVILIVSFRENKEDLFKSQENLKNVKRITH